jgi:hypothetical protein
MFALLAVFTANTKEDHTNEDWPAYTGGFSVEYDPFVSNCIVLLLRSASLQMLICCNWPAGWAFSQYLGRWLQCRHQDDEHLVTRGRSCIIWTNAHEFWHSPGWPSAVASKIVDMNHQCFSWCSVTIRFAFCGVRRKQL